MNTRLTITAAVITALLLMSSCASKTHSEASEESSPALPEHAFYQWCDAFQREDFEALYNLLSTETKETLRLANKDKIKNADDLRNFWNDDLPRLKKMIKGAEIRMEFKFEDRAHGTALWSDGMEQGIDFRRENGVWKIELS